MVSENEYIELGAIGVTNLSILTLINIWRLGRFLIKEDWEGGPFYKKLAFHLLLLLATVVDLPLYAEFISNQDYTLTTYSFHKVSSALLFAAFSITISDWAGVLYDINEYELQPFLLRKATLIGINVLYALVSLTNFIFCYTLTDFDSYTSSSLYIMGIFFQIAVSLILTLFMLSAGLKLAWRIHGVSGARNDLSSPTSGYSMRSITNDKQLQQFTSALWNLNVVMGTCAVCIILQTVLLVLDYGLGYANSTSKTVGPTLFYWTCYFWLPLWGVTCALLYLSRTHSKRQDKKSTTGDITAVSHDSGFLNPLINSVDHSNHYFFGNNHYTNAYNNTYTDTNEFDVDDDENEAGELESGSQSTRSRPSSRNRKQYMSSFDSSDPSPQFSPRYLTTQDAVLRLDSSTVYGSEGQLSGHTDVLFHDTTDTDTEEAEAMFGAVFSPDNSIHMYRDSSLFSPATSTVHHMSPKDMRFSTS